MSKEQDIEKLAKALEVDFDGTNLDLATKLVNAGFGFVGDRVANVQPPPETMAEEEVLGCIRSWAETAVKPYEQHWEDLAYWLTVHRTEELAKGKSTSHPVAPEELTRADLWDLANPTRMDELDLACEKLWSRILQDRAATEARVRAEYQTYEAQILSMSETAEERFNEIESLRDTIAELEKRLQNSVEIDWGKAPDTAVSVAWAYVDKISAFIPDGDFKFHFIPRPTPAKLTPEQMAEAVMLKFAALSKSALFVRKDGRLSYDHADAEWFDNVGDAWGKAISHGWEPWAKDTTGEYHRPDSEMLEGLQQDIDYWRNWDEEMKTQ